MVAVCFDHVSKTFPRHAGQLLLRDRLTHRFRAADHPSFEALSAVSFAVPHGQSLGIIGHNGAGKSTILNLITGLCQPTTGHVSVHGRIAPLLELGAGFHPDLTGHENIRINAALLGLTRKQLTERVDAIVEFAGIGDFVQETLRTYSSGMIMRLAFAVAIHVNADILVVDEVLGVGDQDFFDKCVRRIEEFRRSGGTLICVSHSLGAITSLCDRAIWLDHGKLIQDGSASEVVHAYSSNASHQPSVMVAGYATGNGLSPQHPAADSAVTAPLRSSPGATPAGIPESQPLHRQPSAPHDKRTPSVKKHAWPFLQSVNRWLPSFGCLLILFAVNLFTFADHWRGRTSFTFDFPMGYYAGTAYWLTSVSVGEWPHWIPYDAVGYPAILNPQLGLFYPPFWIVALFRLQYTLHLANIIQVLHVLFGSVGLFLLARRLFKSNLVSLIGAAAFGLFGGFFSNAEHPDIIRAFSWIPWLLLLLLLDPDFRMVRLGSRSFPTRLRCRNLLLPLALSWFICGAYPGVVVSTFVMMAVFIICQVLIGPHDHELLSAWQDAGLLISAIVLGVCMAAIYVLPTAVMQTELYRTQSFGQLAHLYFSKWDILNLIIPSGYVSTSDYSMLAMQLPAALLLFVPLCLSSVRRLLPFYVVAGVATAVCFVPFVSRVPILGWSRFPVGDYRIFLYLAVLLSAVAGLDFAFSRRKLYAQVIAAILAVALVLAFGSAHLAAGMGAPQKAGFLHWFDVWIASAAAVAFAYYLFSHRPYLRGACAIVVLSATIWTGYLTVQAMKGYWSDPTIEKLFYDKRGLPLKSGRELTARLIFSRDEAERPRRITSMGFLDLSWRGYIDGSYMINDNIKSLSEQRIAADPKLTAIVQQPSEMFLIPCSPAYCGGGPAEHVPLGVPSNDARAVHYARNDVTYDVTASQSSLAVENEVFAPGWSGRCELHGEALTAHRVDGALRGWVIPPGHHRIHLQYRTPLLYAAAGTSALAYALWFAVFFYGYRKLSGSRLPFKGEPSHV